MNPRLRETGLVAARLLVGGTFVWLGATKALDPVGFLKLIRQFDVLHATWALNGTAALLPWFEIFCGLLLVLGVRPRAAALLQAVLLLGFTGLVLHRALALHRAGSIPFCAIRFDCGCGNGEVLVCMKLLQNTGLLLLAGWIASVPNRRACLWPDDEEPRRGSG
jgi:uncharacterized membrane protein YphA (DoxX/SURF4 family)